MTDRPGFAALLGRLLAHRGVDAAALARAADVREREVDAVLAGAEASPQLLRRLAPALRLHTADLFVMAGLVVPDDLRAAGVTRPSSVASLIEDAAWLSPESRSELYRFMRSLPVEFPARPGPPSYDRYLPGPSAMVLRLLKNRNIDPGQCAKLLLLVGGGPYVSHATVPRLGNRTVALTAEYVTGFAHLLGISPGDLAAVTGVGPPVDSVWAHPDRVELAEMAWAARRLNSDQLKQTSSVAMELRRADSRRYCHSCLSYHEEDKHVRP
jgi:hypothetical protein